MESIESGKVILKTGFIMFGTIWQGPCLSTVPSAGHISFQSCEPDPTTYNIQHCRSKRVWFMRLISYLLSHMHN